MPEVKNYISAPYYAVIRPWIVLRAPMFSFNGIRAVSTRIYAGVGARDYHHQWAYEDVEPYAVRSFLDELGFN